MSILLCLVLLPVVDGITTTATARDFRGAENSARVGRFGAHKKSDGNIKSVSFQRSAEHAPERERVPEFLREERKGRTKDAGVQKLQEFADYPQHSPVP